MEYNARSGEVLAEAETINTAMPTPGLKEKVKEEEEDNKTEIEEEIINHVKEIGNERIRDEKKNVTNFNHESI